ncbi:MAG: hypothetical protein ACRCUY_03765 [Thermoguttaceae bacterium]
MKSPPPLVPLTGTPDRITRDPKKKIIAALIILLLGCSAAVPFWKDDVSQSSSQQSVQTQVESVQTQVELASVPASDLFGLPESPNSCELRNLVVLSEHSSNPQALLPEVEKLDAEENVKYGQAYQAPQLVSEVVIAEVQDKQKTKKEDAVIPQKKDINNNNNYDAVSSLTTKQSSAQNLSASQTTGNTREEKVNNFSPINTEFSPVNQFVALPTIISGRKELPNCPEPIDPSGHLDSLLPMFHFAENFQPVSLRQTETHIPSNPFETAQNEETHEHQSKSEYTVSRPAIAIKPDSSTEISTNQSANEKVNQLPSISASDLDLRPLEYPNDDLKPLKFPSDTINRSAESELRALQAIGL